MIWCYTNVKDKRNIKCRWIRRYYLPNEFHARDFRRKYYCYHSRNCHKFWYCISIWGIVQCISCTWFGIDYAMAMFTKLHPFPNKMYIWVIPNMTAFGISAHVRYSCKKIMNGWFYLGLIDFFSNFIDMHLIWLHLRTIFPFHRYWSCSRRKNYQDKLPYKCDLYGDDIFVHLPINEQPISTPVHFSFLCECFCYCIIFDMIYIQCMFVGHILSGVCLKCS